MTLRDAILISINTNPGIKGVELVMRVMDLLHSHTAAFNAIDYFRMVEIMIAEGTLIELEYTLMDMPNKVKTLYFPRGTTFGSAQNQTDGIIRHGQSAGSVS